jgi:hypothetical protein
LSDDRKEKIDNIHAKIVQNALNHNILISPKKRSSKYPDEPKSKQRLPRKKQIAFVKR